MESNRKSGQNGKGSNSRIKDIRKYKANWEEIIWKQKRKLKRKNGDEGAASRIL